MVNLRCGTVQYVLLHGCFFVLSEMHALFRFSGVIRRNVPQRPELCVFRGAAPAAPLFIFGGNYEKTIR